MNGRLWLTISLVMLGAAWGATQPFSKVAVDGGYRNFGIIFWQMLIGALVLGPWVLLRARSLRFTRQQFNFCLLIAVIGTILPNGASYQALIYFPAGFMSLVIALVPMFALPIAVALGIDRYSIMRVAGLCLGLVGVAFLSLPGTSLPDAALAIFLPLALIAPALYAVEGTIVAKWGTWGLSPIAVLFGASAIGTVISLPLALISGNWIDPRPPWGARDLAVLVSSILHVFAYAGYVWLLRAAGVVFAGQTGYLVTGFGVLFAMAFLGERYGSTVWIAMVFLMAGLFLVQPRERELAGKEPS